MLVEILIFSTMTLFFLFKWPLFISRKTAVILHGRALEPLFFSADHRTCAVVFQPYLLVGTLLFMFEKDRLQRLSTIESRVGYKMKGGEGKIWYTFAIMISRSQSRPQGFSFQKWVGREKGKALGTSLSRSLIFSIFLFIYLFIEEPIVETKKVVHFNIFTSCMKWSLEDTLARKVWEEVCRQGLKTLTLFKIKIVYFSTLLATLFKKGLA